MASEDWEIPPNLQPDPTETRFDLDGALRAVVGLRSLIPADAFTARVLGTEREGSGVMIRDGLILTIGYLVTEAETIWITTADGQALQGHALAIDQETGFALVQTLGRPRLPALAFGDSEGAAVGASCILASCGGRSHAVSCKIVARQPFAGYWEYLMEDAIFTAPAHPSWGGAALIGEDGRLLGIGSLILQQGQGGRRLDINMVVPVHQLVPVLDDLLARGRRREPPRPWLGLYASEDENGVGVASLAPGGPAEEAGLQPGDRILAVGDEGVDDLSALWRAVWQTGAAGAAVRLRVGRGKTQREVTVRSSDRTRFLKAPRLH
ncbi:MAG TPA: S1C family serine protease [Acetobacteraceae bacterium]|nr:S1C family serine protease [Acetobacteraceae bacterium]